MTVFRCTCRILLGAAMLAGCDVLGPRASDDPVGAADASPGVVLDSGATLHILPAGSVVASIADDAELSNQIRLFDGLNDQALEDSAGVVVRSTGKADGATVRFWSFGPVQMEGNFAIKAPLYVLVGDDGVTPLADHPPLIDSIPGDARYSAMRQIFHVPVTATYDGEIIPSIEALGEALAIGLVDEPRPSGTWVNMPVVVTGTRLEVDAAEPLAATEVLGHGYRVEVFSLGYEQPLRNNQIPVGQASRLLSGVPAGDPPVLPSVPDPQPVFQYGVPAAPPAEAFNYTPLATEIQVRLASGVAPVDITSDADLFARGQTGAITGHRADNVASYAVGATTVNQQIQFEVGSP